MRRKKRILGLALLLLIVTAGYFAWREYAFRSAIREIQEAGFGWAYDDPIELIRRDWRAALRADTWTIERRGIVIDSTSWDQIASHRKALERVRPLTFAVNKCIGNPRMDVIGELQSLRFLSISACVELKDLAGIEKLTKLQKLLILYCPNLENVDAAKGLSHLSAVELTACSHLSREAIDALETALPHATFNHDYRRSFDMDRR